ncbi:nucleocapsid protein [Wuhan Fly Virus 1]|uniref:Nucleoprotein n=1 Tax=Wuhan Fly Virus 1 TaxID=1608101 RepID=A0A0B5KKS7_9VIRU|nr:nucleocapsid protein [Wuhan Fly Virus 1]AJG39320.1 nucleocapsid protein [Wuhan Fly Virus 1]
MSTDWEQIYQEVLSQLESDGYEALIALQRTFAYQGFDPVVTASFIKKKEPTAQIRAKDIYTMIILFITRGNKFEKIMRKSTEDAKKTMVSLKNKYAIVSGRPTKNEDITLARVAATFPMITFKVVEAVKPSRPAEQWLTTKGIVITKPTLKTPGAFALLKRNMEAKKSEMDTIKCLLLIQHAESEIINAQNQSYRSKSLEEKLQDLLLYARAAFNNAMTSEDDRSTFTNALNSDLRDVKRKLVDQFASIFGSSNDSVISASFFGSNEVEA